MRITEAVPKLETPRVQSCFGPQRGYFLPYHQGP